MTSDEAVEANPFSLRGFKGNNSPETAVPTRQLWTLVEKFVLDYELWKATYPHLGAASETSFTSFLDYLNQRLASD